MMQAMADALETDLDAYRPSEATRLRNIVTGHSAGLAICSISGAGGIGKSYLIEQVLSSLETSKSGWLTLRIDAAQEQVRGDFIALIDGQLARRTLGPPANPRIDYFPETRRVASANRALVARVSNELASEGASDDLKRKAVAILKAGQILNKAVPKTQEWVDVAKLNLDPNDVGDGIDAAWETLSALMELGDSGWLPGSVRSRLGMSLTSRLKRDLYGVTANAFVSDLSAALVAVSSRKVLEGTRERIPNVGRLLLVIDDYEALAATLGEFLISSLVPRLAEARFDTVIVIAGRDDLEYTQAGWSQHCKRYLTEPIRLHSFDEETAAQLMAAEGIPESRRAAIYELTQGFPLLLSLAIEDAATDGTSALFLKRFFDRTTRWMSPDEREWFTRTCYLDEVNEDTLRLVFPEEDIVAVQNWFEGEASIRDPSSPNFRVRPLIREKVISYMEVRSPTRHRELRSQAQAG
jgi:hypothetical protein